MVEELFKFTRHGDMKSRTMTAARATKWKKMKKSFVCLPPDAELHGHGAGRCVGRAGRVWRTGRHRPPTSS